MYFHVNKTLDYIALKIDELQLIFQHVSKTMVNKKARCRRYLKNNTTCVVYRCGKQHKMLFMIIVARSGTHVLHTWETIIKHGRVVTSDKGEEQTMLKLI